MVMEKARPPYLGVLMALFVVADVAHFG